MGIPTLEAYPEHLHAAMRGGPVFPPEGYVAEGVEAHAEVNHGRWIVRCPFCPAAQVASDRHRVYYCHGCHNQPVDGRWVRVVWPDDATRRAIEAVLLARPNPETRNWQPGERVTALRAENRRHGLGVK